MLAFLLKALIGLAALGMTLLSLRWAHDFRMHAINEYGFVIHEFDPWFQFRATQYLVEHGWHAFFHWFDHTSWSPLGRPVGTTIFPALQITSAVLYRVLHAYDPAWTLDAVCCLVPVWFGMCASFGTGLLAYECTGRSVPSGVAACAVAAILPAHLLRR